MTGVDPAIADLQSRVAFQEDSLQTLNRVVVEQDAEMRRMQKQIQHLNQKLDELANNLSEKGDDTEPPPPHY